MRTYAAVSFLATFAGILTFFAAKSDDMLAGVFLSGTAAFFVSLSALLIVEYMRNGEGGE